MVSEKIINACKNIIEKDNGSTTIYELLEREMADGLTFYEAELVSQALYNYTGGCKYFFQGSGDDTLHEITPYDVVDALNTLDIATRNNSALYYQVTTIDRCGYDREGQSNATYFDNLLNDIMLGKAKQVVDELNKDTTSASNPQSYEKIVSGKANNSQDRIVFDDFTYILTASPTSITLFRKLTDKVTGAELATIMC